MTNNYYANGRVAVMSAKLMSADKYNRLAECDNIADAIKVLSECGYESMVAGCDYQKVLSTELDNLLSLVVELSTDSFVTRYIMAKYDYHNAKVVAKSKYNRLDNLSYCYHVASIEPTQLAQLVNSDEYATLPSPMAKALQAIDELHLEGKDNPQAIDVLLDKAMYQDMLYSAKHARYTLLKQLVAIDIDTTNIILMYRLNNLQFNQQQYIDMMIEGGTMDIAWLSDSYNNNHDKRVFDMYYHQYRRLFEICGVSSGDFTTADSYVNKLKSALITDNNNSDTISPLLVYFYDKQSELDKIRFILMCIKSGLDKDTTLSRVKEIYGSK